jgi:hypothetical protein
MIMPYLPVLVLGLLALVSFFVSAFLLWASCKICRVRRTTAGVEQSPTVGIRYRRALGTILILSICGLLFPLGKWYFLPPFNDSLAFLVAALLFQFALFFIVLRWLVCPTIGKTLLVGLLFQTFSFMYAIGFVFAVSTTLVAFFNMPTGSMAGTVYGYHRDVTCPTCGYGFAFNCSLEADPGNMLPSPIYACRCPNCRQELHFSSAPPTYREDHPASIQIEDPGIRGGDRFITGQGLLGAEVIPPHRIIISCWATIRRKAATADISALFLVPSSRVEPFSCTTPGRESVRCTDAIAIFLALRHRVGARRMGSLLATAIRSLPSVCRNRRRF